MTNTNATSWRHHFVPKFYLRYWANDDDTIHRYKKINTNIIIDQPSLRQVGFKKNLYSFEPDVPFVQRSSELEDKYFSSIDQQASIIHREIISRGIKHLTPAQRKIYTRFILSLIFRHPSYILKTTEHFRPIGEQALIDAKAHLYNIKHTNLQPEIEQERLHNINYSFSLLNKENLLKNSVLRHIKETIDDHQLIRNLSELQWCCISYRKEAEDYFLTSDNPVTINLGNGLAQGIGIFCLALTPKTLLAISVLDNDPKMYSVIARIHNSIVTSQSHTIFSDREITNTSTIKNKKTIQLLLKEQI